MNPGLQALRIQAQVLKYAACAHLFFSYVLDIRATEGPSMLPTFALRDDWIIIGKRHAKGRGIQVGDVVSYWIPMHPGRGGVKRVMGMPGDFVMTGTPAGTAGPGAGSDEMIQGWSRDSRLFGPIPLALIKGKVLWKFSREDRDGPWVTRMQNGLRRPEPEPGPEGRE
ncbi:MAG: hypothetical protein M1816_004858 [Peltula sp. TS41687]|nr:MAG: hypothetical protein M1816_004858 [Peltula sp. TS41687]